MKSTALLPALCLAAAAALPGTASANIIIDLNPGTGGWVATLSGVNDAGNGNINTAGAAFEAANIGWNTSLGYNDGAWVDYTPFAYPTGPNNGWLPGDPGLQALFLRREFVIGDPLSANFGVEFDDDVQVWVNGTLVINDTNNQYGPNIQRSDLAQYLVAGNNLIAIKGHNSFGGGYLAAFGGRVESLDVDAVPEPASLGMLGLGLLGLAGTRRRKSA